MTKEDDLKANLTRAESELGQLNQGAEELLVNVNAIEDDVFPYTSEQTRYLKYGIMIAGGCFAVFILFVFLTLFCKTTSLPWKTLNVLSILILCGANVVVFYLLLREAKLYSVNQDLCEATASSSFKSL